LPRNLVSTGQSKQAASIYHTNYRVRMDKTAVVLNYGQSPLVQPRYLEWIHRNENPYGENAIVAIMCYTGYNVEDAVLINEAALQRGLFQTTYFTTYEAHEEDGTGSAGPTKVKEFTNVEQVIRTGGTVVVGLKPGYDYSQLDAYGLVRAGTPVDDKTILIGLTATTAEAGPSGGGNVDRRYDMSKGAKKGQVGYVDQTFMSEDETGRRLAKVRLLEQRTPAIGDKFASRVGQKGTIGMVIPEADMPFTKDGLRPDIIVNPHALPSRMTVGQLVESITGKACAMMGGIGDCTAFDQKGSKIGVFGELLTKSGFHSSGNELFYNGMTGEPIESEVFVGPTYYMRLKHMVKDKINYRALGPRAHLTKQPVGGRANDGGLRIGEMERDSVLAHGMAAFVTESMMERGDKYRLAICNRTGMIAIYNPDKNVFLSPVAEDHPARFIQSPLAGAGRSLPPNDDGSPVAGGINSRQDEAAPHIETVSRFGRDFSVVCIPYALKLLIQELQTMNVQMRLITEDNIQQLSRLAYRTTLPTQTASGSASSSSVKPKQWIQQTERALRGGTQSTDSPTVLPASVPSTTAQQLGGLGRRPTHQNSADDDSTDAYDSADAYTLEPTEVVPTDPMTLKIKHRVHGDHGDSDQDIKTDDLAFSSEFLLSKPAAADRLRPLKFASAPAVSSPAAALFQVGEQVGYRRDLQPGRPWLVRDIHPSANLVTIETEYPAPNESELDTIQVITDPACELYRLPTDAVATGEMPMQHPYQTSYTDPGVGTGTGALPGGFTFAPTIRVTNGPSYEGVGQETIGTGWKGSLGAGDGNSVGPPMIVPRDFGRQNGGSAATEPSSSSKPATGNGSSGNGGGGGGGFLQNVLSLGKSLLIKKVDS
jgi:hypothetical protein